MYQDLRFKTDLNADYCLIAPEGRIDTINAGLFEKHLNEYMDGGNIKFIMDFSDLEYISSSGLRVVLSVRKKIVPMGGYIRLCNLQPSIREVFEISGFSNILPVFADLESAIIG